MKELPNTVAVYLHLSEGFTVGKDKDGTTFIGRHDSEIYLDYLDSEKYYCEQMGSDIFYYDAKTNELLFSIGFTGQWNHWFRVYRIFGDCKIEDLSSSNVNIKPKKEKSENEYSEIQNAKNLDEIIRIVGSVHVFNFDTKLLNPDQNGLDNPFCEICFNNDSFCKIYFEEDGYTVKEVKGLYYGIDTMYK